MPTTIGGPYRLFMNVDQVPAEGNRSGSTPYWATATFYVAQTTGSNTFANLEAATASAIHSRSLAQSESINYAGATTYKFYEREKASVDPPKITAANIGEYRHCAKGLQLAEFSGSDARNVHGVIKAKSGSWICVDKDGKWVWSTTIHQQWDKYVKLNQIPKAETVHDNKRSQKGYKNSVTATYGEEAPPPPSG
tara:strand:- start:524 stop:1105 length:582 start_codon:yes stop_codon:yes gene_type:complete